MAEANAPAAPVLAAISGNSITKVTAASMVGSIIEWFDFNLYGSMAALVLGHLFFPTNSAAASTLLSLATNGVAFVARPFGGVIFGHFGDRYGRKSTLVVSLLMMGGGTVLIGFLPTYATLGLAAPILLVVLRIIQGLALGGEYAGGVLMVGEHERAQSRRGYFSAWIGSASPIGYILSAAAIALVSTLTTDDAFNSWGWRLPFIVSGVMVVIGLYIRLSLEESAAFKAAMAKRSSQSQVRLPLVEVIRRYPKVVLTTIGAAIGIHSGYYLSVVYGLAFVRTSGGMSKSTSLWLVVIASVFYFIAIMISGALSDRVGRKLPMAAGVGGFALWAFALFPLLRSGNAFLAGFGFSVGLICLGCLFGPINAWMSEMYGTEVRYTGISLGYSIAAVIGGGIVPLVASAMFDHWGSTVPISVMVCALSVISCSTIALTRRRQGIPDKLPTSNPA